MSGGTRRPSTLRGLVEGRAGAIPVLLVALALVAGCAVPLPSTSATRSQGPTATAATTHAGGTPSNGPAATPQPAATPDPGAWVSGVELPPSAPIASLEPTKATAAGVLTDTSFRLVPLDGSDPVELAGRLTAEPALRLSVRASDGAALVRPAEPLVEGQRYRFTLAAPDGMVQGTWAVQAVAPLAVAGTTPGDGSTNVPVNTGIEVAFNQYGIDLAAAIPYISVSPAVKGHFEQTGKTFALLPDVPLARSTVYTLTVRKGLPLAGTPMVLEEDVVARFETTGTRTPGAKVRPNGELWEARPTERAVIPLQVERYWSDHDGNDGEYPIPKEVDVAVHRLDGVRAGIEAWRSILAVPEWTEHANGAPVNTVGLPRIVDTGLPIRRFDKDNDYLVYVRLPAALDRGWYVVTLTHAAMPRQVVLQVTDLAVYTMVTGTRTVAWVNDLSTKDPVEGATVTLHGVTLGSTDALGLVTGKTPAGLSNDDPGSRRAVLVARAGAQAVFIPATEPDCDTCMDGNGVGRYRLAFHSDRYVYRSTDTINAWGIVRGRTSDAVPARVEVHLQTWTDETASSTAVAAKVAEPDRNGAFLVQIPIRELPYDDYSLELLVNGKRVSYRSITVAPIEKPAWLMSLATSRRAIISGGKVRATVDARFFESTPVAGARIAVEASGPSVTLVTNGAGKGSARVQLRLDEWAGQWDVVSVFANPTLPEEAEIGADAKVAVFRASVILKADALVDGRRLVVSGTLHDVAFGHFERTDDPWDTDPYGPTRAGAKVRVKVVEHTYGQRKVGTEYDWILKRVVPVYEITDHTRDLGTTSLRTDTRGRYRVIVPIATKDRGYEVTVTAADSAGRVTTDSAWAETLSTMTEDDSLYLESSTGEEPVSVGDTVRLRFLGGSGAGASARYLWTVARAGLRSATITSEPRFALTFRSADVPALYVNAVRFNGLAYEPIPHPTRVEFNLEDRALQVDVRPDRPRYAPGGRATLAIRTTDPSGRPVSASVYVGVVDEKLVALGLVDLSDPIYALYEAAGGGILGIAWTHRSPAPESGGEGGDTAGGGDCERCARSDFRDWLFARIVRTGSDGRATVSFDLSDDLTSWHAYVAGIGGPLLAGTGTASLPVSLPFFAELTVAESYLAVDQPVVRVRAFGARLSADDTVTFKVSSDTLRMAAVTVKTRAFESVEVRLPALSVGTHRIRVEALTGTGDARRRDALVRTFEVVTTRTSQASVTSARLDGPTAVAGGEGRTTLILGDAGRGRVIPILEELATASPIRGDRALASGVATRVLRDAFGIEPRGSALDLDLSVFQEDGGYAVLPWGSSEVELSALATLSGDPRLGSRDGFSWAEPKTREEGIWILVGKAATGEPILEEIRSMALRKDLTVAERVALADAAVAAGDDDLAGQLLREILHDAGQRQGPWVRIVSNVDDDQGIVLTARLAIVAAWLGQPVAVDMDAYLGAEPAHATVVDLERALAAKGWVARVPAADAVAVLTVDGKRSRIRIDASQPVSVVLTPAQVPSASLEPISGSVLVTTRTDRPLDPSSLEAPGWLRPVRKVTPSGRIDLVDTVVVRITMTPARKGPYGCLNVTELVPSGLVPIAQTDRSYEEEDQPSTVRPWSIVGQRVDFCVDPDPKAVPVTLRYVARVVNPGRYRWEPTLVQSAVMPDVGTIIPATTITINGIR